MTSNLFPFHPLKCLRRSWVCAQRQGGMDQTISVPGAHFSPGLGKSGLEVAFLLLEAALRFQSLPSQGFYRSLQVSRTPETSENLLGQRRSSLKPPMVAPPSSSLRRLSDRQQVLFSPHQRAELGGG